MEPTAVVADRYGGSPSLHKVLRQENVERRTRTLGLPEAAQLLDFTDKQRTVDVMRFSTQIAIAACNRLFTP